MAVSKVIYDGKTLIDLTGDTVDPSTLAKGVTAHDMSGNKIVGTMEAGGSGDLVDVEEFPTTDVEDGKVYRAEIEEANETILWILQDGVSQSFNEQLKADGISLIFIYVDDIESVTDPQTLDETTFTMPIYVIESSGEAYIYQDGGWISASTELGTARGYTSNIAKETEDGYYIQKAGVTVYTGLGVPNTSNDKKVFTWNGEKWGELKSVKVVENLPSTGVTGMLYYREKVPYPCMVTDNGVTITWDEFLTTFAMALGGGFQLGNEQVIICDALPTENIIEQQTTGLYGEIIHTCYALKSTDTYAVWIYTTEDGWSDLTSSENENQACVKCYNEAWIWNGERFVKVWRENSYYTDAIVKDVEFMEEAPCYVGGLSVIKPKIENLYEHEPDYTFVSPTKDDTTYIVKDLYSDFANYKYTSQFTVCGYGSFAVDKDQVTPILNRSGNTFVASDYFNGVFNPPAYCFYHYTMLKTVHLQSGLNSIGEYAFAECTGLTSIIYDGTKSSWKGVTKYENWDLNTGDYVITCTDGTIAKDGTET